ncbi:hypothetical protein M432DRAFT_596697 [Thermoascus aurantiacus ATCC 26904]
MKYYLFLLAILLAYTAAVASAGSCFNHDHDRDHDQILLSEEIETTARCTGKVCQTDNDCRRFKCHRRQNCVCTQVTDSSGLQKRACGCGSNL